MKRALFNPNITHTYHAKMLANLTYRAMYDVDPNGEFQGGSPKWGSIATSIQMGNFKVDLPNGDSYFTFSY